MFGVQYADRNSGWQNSSRTANQTNDEEEIDYSFSELPVRERRKLFMNDPNPPRIQQYNTLPRAQANTRIWSRAESQSVVNDWVPQRRQSLAPKVQTVQRPYSAYAGQKMGKRKLAYYQGYGQEYEHPQVNVQNQVIEQHIQQSYSAPRQSRQQYRSQICSTMLQPPENHQHYASPGTKVIPSRRSSITITSRERDTVSMGRDVWPGAQSSSQIERPLRVRVYNSDRAVLSPNYAQSVSSWAPSSPVYPAYPAYSTRPADGNTQIFRAVQSPTKSYPRNADSLSVSAYPSTPIYVPLSPKQRTLISRGPTQHDPITIYETMPRKCSTAVFQPSSQGKNRIQPTTINAVQAPLQRKQYDPIRQAANPPYRRVVNRRSPPPDDEKGVSEF